LKPDILIFAHPNDRAAAVRFTDAVGSTDLAIRLEFFGDYDAHIDSEVCLVVCLSHHTMGEETLRQLLETEQARTIGVRLEREAEPPYPIPTYDYPPKHSILGRIFGDAWLSDIVAGIRAIQQNTFPPIPTARNRLLRRRIWTWAVGIAGFMVLVIGLDQGRDASFWPRFNERAAWRELRTANPGCKELRAFLEEYPNGLFAADARLALENPVLDATTVQRSYSLAVSGPLLTDSGADTRAQAIIAARKWAEGDATRQCERLRLAQQAPSAKTKYGSSTESCNEIAGQWQCTIEGNATCEVALPVEQPVCRLR
jgi:hypothetical protein